MAFEGDDLGQQTFPVVYVLQLSVSSSQHKYHFTSHKRRMTTVTTSLHSPLMTLSNVCSKPINVGMGKRKNKKKKKFNKKRKTVKVQETCIFQQTSFIRAAIFNVSCCCCCLLLLLYLSYILSATISPYGHL